MSVLNAMLAETVLSAALHYVEAGLSILPLMGKQNAVSWAKFQIQRPTASLVHWWDFKGKLQNVGIVCGKISKNLVVMDCDGERETEQFELTFPDLTKTLTVKTARGKHFYFFTEDYTKTTRAKGFEVRSDGCYVVAPPSLHPASGQRYMVSVYAEPLSMTSLSCVREWVARKNQVNRSASNKPNNLTNISRIRFPKAYAEAALKDECGIVSRAGEGYRNTALSLAAAKMGNLIKLGWITRATVESDLMKAAAHLCSDEGENSCWKTIQSGIDAGMKLEERK